MKFDILVLENLHIEADRGDGLDGTLVTTAAALALEAVEDGRLARVVQAEDKDAHLLRPEQRLENTAEEDAHRAEERWEEGVKRFKLEERRNAHS